jgi:L-ascorbate metabolism protein UlaG (beta-lactamase superfamily)
MIKGEGKVIYIDPYIHADDIPADDMADILLITQEHAEHCHPESIRKVRKSDATTLVPESVGLEFRGDARRVVAGDSLVGDLCIKGVGIEVVPADTGEIIPEHGRRGVGYIIGLGGLRIYHAGDTFIMQEMNDFSIDVALLPIGGASPMDEDKAAEAVVLLSPGVVIPMHYDPDAMDANPEKFRELVRLKAPNTDVIILDPL